MIQCKDEMDTILRNDKLNYLDRINEYGEKKLSKIYKYCAHNYKASLTQKTSLKISLVPSNCTLSVGFF